MAGARAHDQIKTFQESADEAFADLLKKNGRPEVHELRPAKKKAHERR